MVIPPAVKHFFVQHLDSKIFDNGALHLACVFWPFFHLSTQVTSNWEILEFLPKHFTSDREAANLFLWGKGTINRYYHSWTNIAPENDWKWMVGISMLVLLGEMAYFQEQTVSFKEGIFVYFCWWCLMYCIFLAKGEHIDLRNRAPGDHGSSFSKQLCLAFGKRGEILVVHPLTRGIFQGIPKAFRSKKKNMAILKCLCVYWVYVFFLKSFKFMFRFLLFFL